MSEIQHTIALCEHLYEQMPPLVEREIQDNLSQALEQMKNNLNLSLEEVESVMIFFGKQLWPYREAYKEFYAVYEGMLGEKFFVRKLHPQLKISYSRYMEKGGSFKNLHRGTDVQFFTPDERVELTSALVEVESDVDNYARQTIASTDRKRYEGRVMEFHHILADIETKLDALREMAENEGDHPELVAEIQSHIRGFEHGLCLLGPKVEYHSVLNAHEHFQGRRKMIALHKTVL